MDDGPYKRLLDLFNKADKTPPDSRPTLHEVWHYAGFLEDLSMKQIAEINEFLKFISIEFERWQKNSFSVASFSFIDNNKASGFAVNLANPFLTREFCLRFMAVCSHRLKTQQYVLKLSEVKTQRRGENIETVYKTYLKPIHQELSGGKGNQRYGNVSMETIIINDAINKLVVKLSKYSDANFNQPEEFGDFLKSLTSFDY